MRRVFTALCLFAALASACGDDTSGLDAADGSFDSSTDSGEPIDSGQDGGVEDSGVEDLGNPDTGEEVPQCFEDVYIETTDDVASLQDCTVLGRIRVGGNQLTELGLPSLLIAGSIEMDWSVPLIRIQLPALEQVMGELSLSGEALREISVPALLFVGSLSLQNMPLITDLEWLSTVRSFGSRVTIREMSGIQNTDGLREAITFSGDLIVEHNTRLQRLSEPPACRRGSHFRQSIAHRCLCAARARSGQ